MTLWSRKRSRHEEDSHGVRVGAFNGRGRKRSGRKEGKDIWLRGDCVYSVRAVVVSYTRHVAYYHRYAARRDRSLIQLRYMAIIALQPRLPSVIPAGASHGNSWIRQTPVLCLHFETPSRNFSMVSLSLSFSLSPSLHVSAPAQVTKPRRASLTMGYQNALPFGMSAMVEKFVNLRAALLRIAISDFADIAKWL